MSGTAGCGISGRQDKMPEERAPARGRDGRTFPSGGRHGPSSHAGSAKQRRGKIKEGAGVATERREPETDGHDDQVDYGWIHTTIGGDQG